jgi:hypothetical protein
MRPVRIIAAVLFAAAASASPLLAAPSHAAPAAHADPFQVAHDPRGALLRGEPVMLRVHADAAPFPPATQGEAYVRADPHGAFTRVPLAWDDDSGHSEMTAQVPSRLLAGRVLEDYVVVHDPASGQSRTVPPAGARVPYRSWILDHPPTVPLGPDPFVDHLRAPDAIVASAGPRDVSFSTPPAGGGCGCYDPQGPGSFDVAKDGSILLLDGGNQRLLVWQPGHPTRPARSIPLPGGLGVQDFTLGLDGTIYATYGGMAHLAALTPSGRLRWTAPITSGPVNTPLRTGPDGTVYDAFRWAPLTTPAGRPLPLANQHPHTGPYQPLPGGRWLVTTFASSHSSHEARFALVDPAGQLVRVWRLSSHSELAMTLGATPALVGGDLVVALEVSHQTTSGLRWEHLVARLGQGGGIRLRVALDSRAVWGDSVVTPLRVGADGQLYQLRTSPTTGVRVARYSLGPTQVAAPAPRPAPVAPPATTPTVTHPAVPTEPAPAATLPSTQPTSPAASELARRWLILGLGALGAGTLVGLSGWLWYRRRHPTGSHRPGWSRLAH